MAWLYLILAGLFEMGWPLGFKLANLCPRYHFLFLALSVVSMGVSGWLLYVAQRTIPMGTAYMIWTGIGGVGTVVLGIVFFHDAVTFWRMFFLSLVFVGIPPHSVEDQRAPAKAARVIRSPMQSAAATIVTSGLK